MKNKHLNSRILSLVSSASASLNLTTIFVLTALVVSVLALLTASNPNIHMLQPVVSADEIQPKAVEGGPAAKWQVFQDSEYGVQFQYPPTWFVQEAGTADLNGDLPTERVLLLAPRGRESIAEPVAVEIGLGSQKELERVWPGLATAQSDITAVGYSVLVWQSPSGEVFYVFEHPSVSKLRVAFRNSAGEEEIVNKMVNTFEFTLVHPLVPGLLNAQ